MKKYFLLTSILALTACGGGSGGSGGGSGVNPPELLRASTLIGTNLDNAELTSMASAVVVKNDGSYSDVARAAHGPDTSHAGYKVYKMDNVDFKLLGENGAAFNFGIDGDGRIVKAYGMGTEADRITDLNNVDKFHGKIYQFVPMGSSDEVWTVVDDGNMTQDKLDQSLADARTNGDVQLEDDQVAGGHWNYLEQEWSFDTSGSSVDGLTYSDFGYFTAKNIQKLEGVSVVDGSPSGGVDTGSNKTSVMLFAGGYEILPELTRPVKGAHFEGTAVGVINTHLNAAGDSYYTTLYETSNGEQTATLKTTKATLDIDQSGNTVLTMPFGSDTTAITKQGDDDIQFYDVIVNGNKITFDTTEFDDPVTKRFVIDGTDAYGNAADLTVSEFNDQYYGVTTPVEATGTVMYKYKDRDVQVQGHNAATRSFDFEAGYGMVKKDN